MGTQSPNLECRMYEAKYPEVDMVVMVQVNTIADDMNAYVSLLEYNNIEGLILNTELSRRHIRSVNSVLKVGRIEPMMVLRVESDKGYIDLSKSRVSKKDIQACNERYNKSKLVHSIMRHVAETVSIDLEKLYVHVGWPLYQRYGHAWKAFKIIATDPDSVLNSLTRKVKETGPDGQKVTRVVPAISEDVKDALIKNIRRLMAPQPLKFQADIEMKCFQFDGVLHIKDAMRKAEAVGNNDCPVKIKLVAAPLYVMTAETLDKDQGISVLNEAVVACTQAIEQHKGNLVVKEAPRAVSEQDAKLLAEHMGRLWHANEDVSGDEDSEVEEEEEEEEDTGMGEVDVENTGCVRSAAAYTSEVEEEEDTGMGEVDVENTGWVRSEAAYTSEVEEEEDTGMGEVDVENTGCVRSAAAYTIFIFNLTRIISIFMLLVIFIPIV